MAINEIEIYLFTIPNNKVLFTASIEKLISIFEKKHNVNCSKNGKTYELEFQNSISKRLFEKELDKFELYK